MGAAKLASRLHEDTMNPVIAWAVARLKEPSTWGGLGVFVAGMTFIPPADMPEILKAIALLGTVVPSVLAIAIPEGSKS